ncbi:hypothetical protein P280DRAFT_26590 [Massarina eburnea CBS 473.64]|uniref:Uncharacterized protein n=1 Tax=Massarina eburnea CBS 473.64 TaxID=1395130 RepID=A0A6A6S1G3_9PLEO|nr:hypothetical protein P280DRAFT_26590 [Massarina eburnea CBS 473.64]
MHKAVSVHAKYSHFIPCPHLACLVRPTHTALPVCSHGRPAGNRRLLVGPVCSCCSRVPQISPSQRAFGLGEALPCLSESSSLKPGALEGNVGGKCPTAIPCVGRGGAFASAESGSGLTPLHVQHNNNNGRGADRQGVQIVDFFFEKEALPHPMQVRPAVYRVLHLPSIKNTAPLRLPPLRTRLLQPQQHHLDRALWASLPTHHISPAHPLILI